MVSLPLPQLFPVLQGEVHGYVVEVAIFWNTQRDWGQGGDDGSPHSSSATCQASGKNHLVRSFRCETPYFLGKDKESEKETCYPSRSTEAGLPQPQHPPTLTFAFFSVQDFKFKKIFILKIQA